MNEIYWLTRLDAIHGLLCIVTALCGITIWIFLMIWANGDFDNDRDGLKEIKSRVKKSVFAFIILLISAILTPTQREALLIYGVGGTIDYIKSNDKAKELPDKAIICLDKLLDEYIEKEKNDRSN